MDLDNCGRCQWLLPCDWHMAAHVTLAAWWWAQHNRDTDATLHPTRRWMAALISSSDRWLSRQLMRPQTAWRRDCLKNQMRWDQIYWLYFWASGIKTSKSIQFKQANWNKMNKSCGKKWKAAVKSCQCTSILTSEWRVKFERLWSSLFREKQQDFRR